MANGPRLLIKNACYHVYSRGNQKQQIFFDKEDYETYISILRRYKKKFRLALYGFCLMLTHVHLVCQPEFPKQISTFMHALQLSYSIYFNKKYKKVGHLWQDRFKSKVVMRDRYLIDCVHYVEMNPVRAGMVESPADYPWSSYKARVLGEDQWPGLVDTFCLEE